MTRFRNAFGVPLVAALMLLNDVAFAQFPGTPTNVQASITGSTLNVSWTAPTSGATPSGYRLDFRSGGTVVASVTAGATTSTSIAIPPGVTGTFTVTVTAIAGNSPGSPSAPTTFILGGGCTPPTTPTRITAGVFGGQALFQWVRSANADSYAVQAGTSMGSSNLLNGIIGDDFVSGTLPAGLRVFVRTAARNSCGQSLFTHDVVLPPPSTCAVDSSTACSLGGRFLSQVSVRPQGASAPVLVPVDSRFTDGALFFFQQPNVDLLVRVVNSCGTNNSYGVSVSGTGNVELSITVTDTQRGVTRAYFNPEGQGFQPIQDTSAFATCP